MLAMVARDHIEQMLREAEHYHRMIDAAPLTFQQRRPVVALRRAVADSLTRLAEVVAPHEECCA